MDRKNLTLSTGSMATRLLFEGNRCVGVEYVQDGETKTARASREVIVCGGAIESPKLLMLSGIGAADHLAEHGIDTLVDLPGVGQNFHNHVLTGVIRPADVGPGNVVPSTAVGHMRIRYFGRGLIKDNLSPGWLLRIINKIF